MNLLLINKEFDKLKKMEEYLTYKFEPRAKKIAAKRHIYYKDLKSDFVDEVNAYGFSPFIQKTYEQQKKDKNIMRFKNKDFQNGLLNFVKKSHNKQIKSNNKNDQQMPNINQKVNSNKDENQDVFLQKALENLAKNKLNYTDDSNEISVEKVEELKETRKKSAKIIQKKENNKFTDKNQPSNILNYKVHVNPFLSFSIFNQPEPNKKNFDRFFNTKSAGNKENSPKRQIAIFKTKAIENHMKNKEDMKKSLNEIKNNKIDQNEINRNDINVADTIKIVNGKGIRRTVTGIDNKSKGLIKKTSNLKNFK